MSGLDRTGGSPAEDTQIAILIAQNTALRQELERCHVEIAALSQDVGKADKKAASVLSRLLAGLGFGR